MQEYYSTKSCTFLRDVNYTMDYPFYTNPQSSEKLKFLDLRYAQIRCKLVFRKILRTY